MIYPDAKNVIVGIRNLASPVLMRGTKTKQDVEEFLRKVQQALREDAIHCLERRGLVKGKANPKKAPPPPKPKKAPPPPPPEGEEKAVNGGKVKLHRTKKNAPRNPEVGDQWVSEAEPELIQVYLGDGTWARYETQETANEGSREALKGEG